MMSYHPELVSRDQWVCWRYETREGKKTKIPYDPRNGHRASSTNPSTWVSFQAASELGQDYDGLGFMFSPDDPLAGIDLDHCVDAATGKIEPWAIRILGILDSYAEVSPSGTGIHIWVRGHVPGPRKVGTFEGHKVEMYDQGRYFTVVGQHIEGTPDHIMPHDDALEAVYRLVFGASSNGRVLEWDEHADDWNDETLLAHARGSRNGEKFRRLFDEGDTSYHNNDDHIADLSLCSMLAFWTGKDVARMDKLFRRSGLMRPKWDSKRGSETYGSKTIARAIGQTGETYGESKTEPDDDPASATPITLWTTESLLEADFPPLRWIVEGLLPEGLVILAGRPKRGKSWMALQIAVDVVSGTHSLGPTTIGKVLYIALEDSPRRLQSRLRQMQANKSRDLIFLNELPALDNGGAKRLGELIETYNPALVVIDTLARVMGRKRDQDSTSDMTDFLAPLQTFAGHRHCCILLIDHHRKPGAEVVDMIDDIAGSTAKTAVADAILGLYKKTGDRTAQLKIIGRDVEEKELTLSWDALKFRWNIELEAILTPTEKDIIALIREIKETKAIVIASQLSIGLRTAQWNLNNLVTKGLVEREAITNDKRGRPEFVYRLKVAQ